MQGQRSGLLPNFVAAATFFVAIFFHTSEIVDISIKTATPFILLPLITAYAIFAPFGLCMAAGLISGALIDSVSTKAYCFNTIALMLIAVLVCIASAYLFNKNLKSAIVLALLTAAFYYIFLWLFFYNGTGSMQDSIGYLLKYALPSAVYSSAFIFPFYYLFKFLYQ